jgi:hypothetical protein
LGEANREARYLLLYTRGDLVGQQVMIGGQGALHGAIASLFEKGRLFRFERTLEASIEVTTSAFPVRRSRTSADRLPGGQPPLTSFDALQSLPGFERGVEVEVIVADEAGTTTRGRISSVSSSELAVASRRPNGRAPLSWFRSPVPEERTFEGDTVRTVKVVDGTRNGQIIGGLVGVLLGIAYLREHLTEDYMLPAVTMWPGVLGGYLVDDRINRRVYQRAPQTPRVTLAPMPGHTRAGLIARVRF